MPLAYGAFFDQPVQLEMRDRVLQYGFCDPGPITTASGFTGGVPLVSLNISIKALWKERPPNQWMIPVDCTHSFSQPTVQPEQSHFAMHNDL